LGHFGSLVFDGLSQHTSWDYEAHFILHASWAGNDLPSMQSLRAKLSTDIRDSEHGPPLENLKSRLRTAYKIAREQGRRSHATNKRYYDKRAKNREF